MGAKVGISQKSEKRFAKKLTKKTIQWFFGWFFGLTICKLFSFYGWQFVSARGFGGFSLSRYSIPYSVINHSE